MGANRPAAKEAAYVEIDLNLLKETGEIKIVGSPIIAPTLTTTIPRGKFEVTYTAELFDIMKTLGNKKIEVLSYLLDHKDGSNSINITNTELANATHTSRPTVIETLKALSDAGLVTRKGTVTMISPRLMVKGNQLREAWLMRKFEEIDDANVRDSKILDFDVDNQLAFNKNGEIVERANYHGK